jgi:hypothetical protein
MLLTRRTFLTSLILTSEAHARQVLLHLSIGHARKCALARYRVGEFGFRNQHINRAGSFTDNYILSLSNNILTDVGVVTHGQRRLSKCYVIVVDLNRILVGLCATGSIVLKLTPERKGVQSDLKGLSVPAPPTFADKPDLWSLGRFAHSALGPPLSV